MDRGDIVALLTSEARKRPIVADLLARAHLLTDDEIDNANVPLKWYKQALREARSRQSVKVAQAEWERQNPIEDMVVVKGVNAIRGSIIAYAGTNFFEQPLAGAAIEIRHMDLFFLPHEETGVWQNQTFFPSMPPAVMAQHRVVEKDVTRHEYVLALAEDMLRKYPG